MDDKTFDRFEKQKKKKKKEKRSHSDALQQGKCAVTSVEVGKIRHRKAKHLLGSGTNDPCDEAANHDALGGHDILVNDKDIDNADQHLSNATELKPAKKRKSSKEHKEYGRNCEQDKGAVSSVEAEKKLKKKKKGKSARVGAGDQHLTDDTELKPAKKRKRSKEHKEYEGNCERDQVAVSGVEAEKMFKKKKSGRIGADIINEIKSSETGEGRENHFGEDIMEKSSAANGKENKNKKRRRNEDHVSDVHEGKVIKDDRYMNESKKKTESEANMGSSCEGKGTEVGGDLRKKKKKNKNKGAASAGNVSDDRMTTDDIDVHLLNNNGKTRWDKGKKVRSRGSDGVLESKGAVEAGKPSSNSVFQRTSKKVRFSGDVEVFSSGSAGLVDQNTNDGLVRGKWFSREEDELIRTAVYNYIEEHGLGEKGEHMVLNCKKYQKEVKGCWKEISAALPWRPVASVYTRAHCLLERGKGRKWSVEELQHMLKLREEYGPKWKAIANELGRHRNDVKDAYRRYKEDKKTGHWSQDEYQTLFDLVSEDLRMKALNCTVKKKKHGMLRDNISWNAVGEKLTTRLHFDCCIKWYKQLQSPMVQEGKWADVDDYRMVTALAHIDASCEEDVDWDDLLDNRSGEVCLERWNQMVRYIGEHGMKSFPEQVEILSQRYCPELAEAREKYDSLPVIN